MYLSTCNRVEFHIVTTQKAEDHFLTQFLMAFNKLFTTEEILRLKKAAEVWEGTQAVKHSFKVASSLDSMVVGEREIITQFRNAYDTSRAFGLTGDTIRLVVKHTVETAKRVYTETNIARNPVSVVSLAYREMIKLNVRLDGKILVVGAGKTNKAMCDFLFKHGYKDFVVFNRSVKNAEILAKAINGEAYPLSEIANYKEGFDAIITCTAAEEQLITQSLYSQLLQGDNSHKVVIDLAVPHDFDEQIAEEHKVTMIQVKTLRSIAEKNLKAREKEMENCEAIVNEKVEDFIKIHRQRQIELAMQEVPNKVKEIHEKALSEVFAKDIEQLDDSSKAILDRVLAYVEKKYISVPMKMAREIILEEKAKTK
eukprot:gnl/MRDRNA2_/MRDRNA2_65037_c0_seq1.p1 gnl/MRDRNA2_/MRDRNA2_65037_c0~~gnl/MRDRNA2_/MRDRNA2_65037_c0_seq1.p1  ORF type:complete len:368 (+),score=30.12 gnl/MRDRNA2_/MRDRNA2_65037_c0_seq1:166-1269(+)